MQAVSMLISGSTSAQSGCVVRDASDDQVFLAPCLDAISTGLGKKIFLAEESGGTGMTFESATSPGLCLASVNPIGGWSFMVKSCDSVGASGFFTFTESGQLKLQGLGNYCVIAKGAVLSTLDSTTVSAAKHFFAETNNHRLTSVNKSIAHAGRTSIPIDCTIRRNACS